MLAVRRSDHSAKTQCNQCYAQEQHFLLQTSRTTVHAHCRQRGLGRAPWPPPPRAHRRPRSAVEGNTTRRGRWSGRRCSCRSLAHVRTQRAAAGGVRCKDFLRSSVHGLPMPASPPQGGSVRAGVAHKLWVPGHGVGLRKAHASRTRWTHALQARASRCTDVLRKAHASRISFTQVLRASRTCCTLRCAQTLPAGVSRYARIPRSGRP